MNASWTRREAAREVGAGFVVDAVAAAPPPSRVTANLVHFMPGARTHWHRHPLSQTVFVNEGDDQHDVVHWLTPVTDDEYAAPALDR